MPPVPNPEVGVIAVPTQGCCAEPESPTANDGVVGLIPLQAETVAAPIDVQTLELSVPEVLTTKFEPLC